MPSDKSTFHWVDLVTRSTRLCVVVFAYLDYLYSDIVLYAMINIHPTHHNPESQFPKIPPAPCLPMQYAKEDNAAVQPSPAIFHTQAFLD